MAPTIKAELRIFVENGVHMFGNAFDLTYEQALEALKAVSPDDLAIIVPNMVKATIDHMGSTEAKGG